MKKAAARTRRGTPAKGEASARERILATASELFYREGIRAIGVDTVVERSGVSLNDRIHVAAHPILDAHHDLDRVVAGEVHTLRGVAVHGDNIAPSRPAKASLKFKYL